MNICRGIRRVEPNRRLELAKGLVDSSGVARDDPERVVAARSRRVLLCCRRGRAKRPRKRQEERRHG
ncbi:MAG: hypothetical protein ACREI7_13215, partial [Myxococcota bacterium]